MFRLYIALQAGRVLYELNVIAGSEDVNRRLDDGPFTLTSVILDMPLGGLRRGEHPVQRIARGRAAAHQAPYLAFPAAVYDYTGDNQDRDCYHKDNNSGHMLFLFDFVSESFRQHLQLLELAFLVLRIIPEPADPLVFPFYNIGLD